MSVRTVYRDLRALDESGVPIGFEPGKGYFITEGYFLPPVMFTEEEALAMISVGKMLGNSQEASLQKEFGNALEKVKSVLPVKSREKISLLEDRIKTIEPSKSSEHPNHFLITAEKAMVHARYLKLGYKSLNQAYSERLVGPLGIYYHFENWYLLAYCTLRKAVRDFRFDRVISMKESEQVFTPPSGFSLPDYLKKRMEDYPRTLVEVAMSEADFACISGMKYVNGYIQAIEKDDTLLVSFMVSYPEQFCKWLLLYCDSARIVSPEAMLEVQDKLIEKINKKFSAILT
jgi:predicted DNA-binding transcriptional regulator YafY